MLKNALQTILVFVFIWTVSLQVALAVEVEGLYQVKVGVENQSNKTRWAAVVNGFKEVMVRRSGSQNVLASSEVQKAYAKVTAYLQRYEYEPVSEKDAEYPFNLVLHFEPRLVDQLIQEAGMPIWGSNRPVTVLWIATEENFTRQVIKDSEEQKDLVALIKEQAQRRGVPIFFPLMDLEDQLNVTQSDIWGRFATPVIEASERYAADSIVTGRVYRQGEIWYAQLVYINDNREQRIEFNETSQEMVYTTLTNRLAEMLCEKYCVVEQVQTDQLVMQVSNINSFADFKAVENYLDGLSSIRKVEVHRVASTFVRLNISLLGELENLTKDIELSQKLIPETAPLIDPFSREADEELPINGEPVVNSGEGVLVEAITSQDENNLQTNNEGKLLNQEAAKLNEANQNLISSENQSEASQKSEMIYYRWQR